MKIKILLSAILLCTAITMQGQWTYTNLSEAKTQMGAASLGNKAYFGGGTNMFGYYQSDVEIYDLKTESWTNSSLSFARQFPAGVSCGSKVFFAGGVRFPIVGTPVVYDIVDIYDTITQQWTVEYLSAPRFGISAVAKGNTVLFAGGADLENGTVSDVVDIYDIETGTWTTATLSLARSSMSNVVVGNLAIFAGGFDLQNCTDRVDIYNFFTNTWTTETLSLARFFSAAAVVGTKVIIAGGMTIPTDSTSSSDRVDIYDTWTGNWTIDTLTFPRAFFSEYGATVNNKAFFVGGGNFLGSEGRWTTSSNLIDIYDEENDIWSVDYLTHDVVNHSVITVGSHLLVAGGYSISEDEAYSTVEIFYDPPLGHIIHVPADYPTIQQGIAAAGPGDTVLVADGLYYENINFLGKKPLVVASEFLMDGDTNHISNTFIDGSQPTNPDIGSVVTFESEEDTTSVLCGFTITGGTGTVESSENMRMGGGLHIKFSGGKFLNNHIHDNTVSYNGGVYGGGMQLGGPISEIPWIVLRGNRIYNNEAKSSADYASGGGFFCFYNLIMEYNEISHNAANGYLGGDGAGVAIGGAFGLIEIDVNHNEVTHNEAVTAMGTNSYATLGGGMSFYWDITGNVSNNVISFNSLKAPGTYWSWGPGVFIQDIISNGFLFENNRINDNYTITTQTCRGGGVSLLRSGGKYQNNVIQNNSASHGGGFSIIISNEVGDTAILINNTITDNEATFGGGIYAMSSKSVIVNSIIWGNKATTGPSINQTESTLEVRYSDVQGGVVWAGEGNINEEPQFQSDGYHLDYSCTLLNMGASSVIIDGESYNCPAYDIDGQDRPYSNTLPDIGADEAQWQYVSIEEAISGNFEIYPNPVKEQLIINYELENESLIIVELFNTTGTLVQSIAQQTNSAGKHQIELNTANLQPGLYFIRMQAGNQMATKKVVKL